MIMMLQHRVGVRVPSNFESGLVFGLVLHDIFQVVILFRLDPSDLDGKEALQECCFRVPYCSDDFKIQGPKKNLIVCAHT